MCGIAGGVFWSPRIAPNSATQAVDAMVTALAHRGPDGRGVRAVAPVAPSDDERPLVIFGHTRLAILDVTDAGRQPMGGESGQACMTYNGEAYNFAELKSELERGGARFSTRTDTEVLLRGYDAW